MYKTEIKRTIKKTEIKPPKRGNLNKTGKRKKREKKRNIKEKIKYREKPEK